MDDRAHVAEAVAVGCSAPNLPGGLERPFRHFPGREGLAPGRAGRRQASASGKLPLGLGRQAPPAAGRLGEPRGKAGCLVPCHSDNRLPRRVEGGVPPPGRLPGPAGGDERLVVGVAHRSAPQMKRADADEMKRTLGLLAGVGPHREASPGD